MTDINPTDPVSTEEFVKLLKDAVTLNIGDIDIISGGTLKLDCSNGPLTGTLELPGFKMPTAPLSGQVLTTDADGVGTWQDCPGEISIKDIISGEKVQVTDNSLKVYPIETIEVKWTTEADFNKGTNSDTQTTAEQLGAVTLKGGSTTAYAVWHMNETSGTNVPDATGNNRNGTAVNLPLWMPGRFNNCLQFDGVNMYVNCGDIANWERTNKFSVECWFKTSSTATMALIGRRYHTGLAYAGWELNMNNGKIQMILCANITNGYYIAKTTDLQFNDSNWHHVIATYNGNCALSGLNVYIDGALASTTTSGTSLGYSILFAGNCLIGMRNAATAPYSGLIDEAILYDKELSDVQVLQRYTGGEWGADYPASGTYTSNVYDSQFPNLDWKKIYFNQLVPANTTTTYKARTSVDNITWGAWSSAYSNGDDITEVGRYIQWKADLTTTDNTTTPKIYDLSLTYLANPRNIVSP